MGTWVGPTEYDEMYKHLRTRNDRGQLCLMGAHKERANEFFQARNRRNKMLTSMTIYEEVTDKDLYAYKNEIELENKGANVIIFNEGRGETRVIINRYPRNESNFSENDLANETTLSVCLVINPNTEVEKTTRLAMYTAAWFAVHCGIPKERICGINHWEHVINPKFGNLSLASAKYQISEYMRDINANDISII